MNCTTHVTRCIIVSLAALAATPCAAQTLGKAAQAQASAAFTPDLQARGGPQAPAAAAGASASAPGKWEVEVHGGGLFTSRSSDGDSALPAPGTAFTTLTGQPSRRVGSWYFGDGTTLYNSIPGPFRVGPTITSLNPALAVGATSENGGVFGGRVGYAITPRLTAEFTLDYGLKGTALDEDVQAMFEASRASFAAAWTPTLTFVTVPVVTSTVTVDEGSTHQLASSGVVLYKLTPESRITPFVLGGIGFINNLGDDPVVTLVGSYAFTVTGSYAERDSVTVQYAVKNDVVGIVGGGFTYAVNPKSGIRVDVRALLGSNSARTLVTTAPTFTTATSGSAVASSTNPSVQFSNSATFAPSSLNSAAAVTDFESFTGSGMASTINISAGWYFRF